MTGPIKAYRARVHHDKTLSFETAKLLGVGFTWSRCCTAVRFIPADSGYRVQELDLQRTPVFEWKSAEIYEDLHAESEDLFDPDTGRRHKLFLVTLESAD